MLLQVSRVQNHFATHDTWHSRPGFQLIFLLEGASGYEFTDEATVELHGGEFLVVPPHTVYRGLCDVRAPYTLCKLALNGTPPRAWTNTPFTLPDNRRLFTALQRAGDKAHSMDPSLRWLVRRLTTEVLGFRTQARRAEAQAALRALVCVVLVEAARQVLAPPATPGGFASAAMAYLREHIHDTVYMADLVRHLGFSRARLFEIFKAQTGHTPNEYLQRLRVQKAEELLRRTNKSVTEIALATGFGSGQHFSLVFRRYTNLAPAGYRKASRSGGPRLERERFSAP